MAGNRPYFHAYDYSYKLRDRPGGAVNAQSDWARTVRQASRVKASKAMLGKLVVALDQQSTEQEFLF